MNFSSGEELLAKAQELKHIYNVVMKYESHKSNKNEEDILDKLKLSWHIMQEAIQQGLDKETKGKGHMIGGEALKMKERYTHNNTICGNTMAKAISYGLSTMEVNACMGRIVACPTAGSSGVLPGILLMLKEEYEIPDEKIIKGLLTASGIGIIIGKNASLSGAEGGCQAEVGSASAMAAAAVVEIMGGTPAMALSASAIALQNLMGLICDPVAGLVEVPCQKRNAIGIANGLIASEMALAGIESVIPFDEVVHAMKEVSKLMPSMLRETAQGGIATTPTAKKFEKEIFSQR
ncbi:L-serine ammonia-lyase [Natranaerovirga pectinivora]|uniref:L-serine dehydratase n=1 Tax=Natranaerovirga pectinivora TaxID=682400 RepID=A0A4R3MDY6_9FIRM|nr:L-serine ammonia-lyase, iron-sulfur-dependent, subunit alpha [Natranaerovirga pectinivora]TCT11676.1 L-serine ammonia-lyase [Natranaerovirga pectinivora]